VVTYLDLLNRARARQASSPISATSIAQNTGDSLQGVQAINNAVATFFDNSFDLDATEKVVDIVTATSLLTPPVPSWDSNVIKAVKLLQNNQLLSLGLVSLEEAEDLKLQSFVGNEPRFWYVNQGNVYILPVPTATYTIKVFYQLLYPDITVDNMTSTVILPQAGYKTLTDLIYANLREQIGDPQWATLKEQAKEQVMKFYQRNKYSEKRQGMKKFVVRPRKGDRKL
jgi:hypothetical protein